MLKLSTVSAGVLCLMTSLAIAQTSPAPATGTTGTTRTNSVSSELQAIRAASVSMAQAIEIVEKQAGGRAISIDFEERDGNEPAHYEIKVVSADGKLVEYNIDAMTGAVLKSENQPIERYFTRLKPADIQTAKTSLKDAIALAERQAGPDARAIEAEIEREGGTVAYEIEVAVGNDTQDFDVTADGQVKRD
jgi:uncharacterized membrane protein YkoI